MSDHSRSDDGAARPAILRILAGERREDDGFAMLTVILLILVCAMLSVLMLGVVVAQVKPTVFEKKNTQTISAAEAGVDATLSQLRTATTTDLAGNVFGDSSKLPCTVAGTIIAGSATLRYDVAVSYFVDSPASKDPTWRADNAVKCTPGTGTSYPPAFAIITAQGKDGSVGGYASSVGNRTLETLYSFQVTNTNVAGGIMYNWGRTDCLHAFSVAVGAKVIYAAATSCTDDSLNLWSYKIDYTIRLAATDFAGATTPLCLTGPTTGTGEMSLQKCTGATTQLFAWHDGARFFEVDADGKADNTLCVGVGNTVTDPTGLKLQVGSGTTWCSYNDPAGSFDPDPRVGAGKASAATQQVVSYLEFGRCFDVTNMDVNWPLMILYPCKQAPGSTDVLAWNHKWIFNEPSGSKLMSSQQTIMVNAPSGTYCLTAPSTTPLVAPGYALLKTCTGGGAANQTWVRYAEMAKYSDSWTIRDKTGAYCLAVGPKSPPDKLVPGDNLSANLVMWSTIVMAPCTGGVEQKWNAPANAQKSTLDNFKELN